MDKQERIKQIRQLIQENIEEKGKLEVRKEQLACKFAELFHELQALTQEES